VKKTIITVAKVARLSTKDRNIIKSCCSL